MAFFEDSKLPFVDTTWKTPATQFLREIKYSNFGASITAILTVSEALNLNFGRITALKNAQFCKFQNFLVSKIVKNATFRDFKIYRKIVIKSRGSYSLQTI